MEQHQPLLALCAAHWKADHVLGNTLLVKSSAFADNDSEDEHMDTDKPKTQESSESKKRPASRPDSTSREVKKRKKETQAARRLNNANGIPDTASKHLLNESSTVDTATGATTGIEATSVPAVSHSATTTPVVNILNMDAVATAVEVVGVTEWWAWRLWA